MLPETSSMQTGPAARRISAIPPSSDLATRLTGLETPAASTVTQPLRAIDAKLLVRGRPVDSNRASNTASRGLASRTWNQRFRLLLFAINGMNVFVVGLLIQVMLVRYVGMGHVSSYILQTVTSVQMSFLLSRFLTWRDRDVPFVRALARFNVQQLAVTGLGMAGYAGLERLGVNYKPQVVDE